MMVSVVLAESSCNNDDDFVLIDCATQPPTYNELDIFSLTEQSESNLDDIDKISTASSYDYCDDFITIGENTISCIDNYDDFQYGDDDIPLSTSGIFSDNETFVGSSVGDNELYVDKQLAILADQLSSLMSDGQQSAVASSDTLGRSSGEIENGDKSISGSLFSSSVPSCDEVSTDWPFVIDNSNAFNIECKSVSGSTVNSVYPAVTGRSRISNKKKRKQMKMNKKKAAATAAFAHFATNMNRNSSTPTVTLPSSLNTGAHGTNSSFISSAPKKR